MSSFLNKVVDRIYSWLTTNTKLKTTDDIIKYRSEYRPLTLGLIKQELNSSNAVYDNNIVYNLLDSVSSKYVLNS